MIFRCSSCSCTIFGVLIVIFVGIITYFKWSYSYWKRRNLPYLIPNSWYGTMQNPLFQTLQIGVWLKRNYDEFKETGFKHGGIYNFTGPVYFPVDPDYIKNILQNDFQYFVNRGEYYNEEADPLSGTLFSLDGQRWRNLRAKLTPVFTSGKLKMMFETLVDCSNPLKGKMDELTEKKQKVDVKDLASRYTTDVIGSCAFGLDCNSFENPNAEFRQYGKQILELSTFRYIIYMVCQSFPSVGHLLKLRVIPKSAADFVFKVVQDTVNYRNTNKVKRSDFLQLLTEIKLSISNAHHKSDGSALTIEEIAAQCVIFLIAGFETSSSTLTFCLYELGKNPGIQQKVRDEIQTVLSKHEGKITYDSLLDLKYMTQVLEETLRKYPSLPMLTRECVKDYQVPNTNIVIEKGTSIFISNYGLHHDPDYYPNPDKFDPERFSEPNKRRRHQFTYLPFGEGPRNCIGLRFGMMQMRVCLTVLLQNFVFTLNQNTPNALTFKPSSILLDTNEIIYLDSKPIHKVY